MVWRSVSHLGGIVCSVSATGVLVAPAKRVDVGGIVGYRVCCIDDETDALKIFSVTHVDHYQMTAVRPMVPRELPEGLEGTALQP
eukprot:9021923-Pyramimonas_sp.AAC.1